MKSFNEKEKESEKISKSNQDKFSSTSKEFYTIFNNPKTSLSKLLKSIYNYNKRTCNALKIEFNNKKNDENDTKTKEEQKKEEKEDNIMDEIKLTRNPSITTITSHMSTVSNKYENKKYASLASYTFLNINNNKHRFRKKINTRNNANNSCIDKNNKKLVFDFNNDNNEKNKEINKIIDQLLILEQNTTYLLTKIKIPNEFHKECSIWINSFTQTCLYDFKTFFYKNFNNNFDININNNKKNLSSLLNQDENIKKELYYQLNFSINILIVSIIIAFWRSDEYNIDINMNININYIKNVIKDLSEIMIINHKVYLLICLWILSDSNYFDYNNNLYKDEKIGQLKEQMKKYLNKKLNTNNFYYINNNLIIEELKSSTNILHSILKIILKENKHSTNSIIYRLSKNINNLNEIAISELINNFYNYININNNNKNNLIENYNNLNINEYKNDLKEEQNTNRSSIPDIKKSLNNLQDEIKSGRHRRIQSNITNIDYTN